MIYLLLLTAILAGAALRRRSPPSVPGGDPAWAVDRLSGPGWSLVALDPGPLRAVDMDDPTVDIERAVALAFSELDVN